MNLIAMIGNAATTPELRYTASGKPVCTFRIAVSRSGADEADFFTVTAWERQAEIVNEYVTKGRRIGVEGRLHHSTWQVDDERKSSVEIVAHRVQPLHSKKNEDA